MNRYSDMTIWQLREELSAIETELSRREINEPPQEMKDGLSTHRPGIPASGSPDNGGAHQLNALDPQAVGQRSKKSTPPTIEELIGRLEGTNPYVDPDLADEDMAEAAVALRELVQERDHWKERQRISEEAFQACGHPLNAPQSSLTQHKDWLREALDGWEAYADGRTPRSPARITQIRKLMEK